MTTSNQLQLFTLPIETWQDIRKNNFVISCYNMGGYTSEDWHMSIKKDILKHVTSEDLKTIIVNNFHGAWGGKLYEYKEHDTSIDIKYIAFND